MVGAIVLIALLAGAAQASEACDLLSRLSEIPGINIIQVTENSYLLTIEYLDGVCNRWFEGDCMPDVCGDSGTCCPGSCNGCYVTGSQSLCCKKLCRIGPIHCADSTGKC
jgi:hypothetical protein